MKILHNNRCSKSRCALEILENKGVDFEIVKYLENPLSASEIKDLLKKLDMPSEAIIRKGEADYKANFKGKTMSENDWIDAMVKFPKLIERPIIIKGDKAVVGRPPENIEQLLG
ncbi:MAG: arsenate reductase (glutaredoxin) [Crocinitomix sp.]|nr:arsenate reductase (glutaredoxin) [Crocinitomix sp.]